MLEAVLHEQEDLRVDTLANPTLGPEDIMIRAKVCGLCISDLRAYLSRTPVKTPVVLAFVESPGCCIHGMELSNVRFGDTSVLIGAGPTTERIPLTEVEIGLRMLEKNVGPKK